jgi:ATP-dependent RNA helicase DeaD
MIGKEAFELMTSSEDKPIEQTHQNGEAVVEPENALPSIPLNDLPEALRQAAGRAGWKALTPVQARAIPYLLAGRDLMVQSRTGSGKTGAFVLPILDKIDPSIPACQALVLTPTRELAQQVASESLKLAGEGAIRTVAVYGGVSYKPQLEGLKKGAHLVVGTPGRILDHLIRRTFDLNNLKMIVFDEADHMMSMGFYPDMREIAGFLPRRRSGYMFSATYPLSVKRLAKRFLHEPEFLSLSPDAVHVAETAHCYYEVNDMEKDRALVRIIEVENPESAIVFCNTRAQVAYVSTVLQRFGYDADQLTSDLNQGARDKVMKRLREHTLRFLVATDIAARGIDISNLSHVINYEIPEDVESYIHRTGRTGRAGASGVAISLAGISERTQLKRIGKHYKMDIELRPLPQDSDVEKIVSERLTAHLEALLRARDRLKVERMKRFVPLVRGLAEHEDEIDLLAMVLDDLYQRTLHAPPAVPEEKEALSPEASSKTPGRKKSRRPRRRK